MGRQERQVLLGEWRAQLEMGVGRERQEPLAIRERLGVAQE